MADLQLVLGGPWTPPAPLAPKAPEDQLVHGPPKTSCKSAMIYLSIFDAVFSR